MHVAAYTRISRDQEGRREGVAIQEAHSRRYARERWPDLPVIVYSDNDLSASNGDPRPGYSALVAAVRRGEVAQVVCAEQSRLTRQPAEWEALLVTLAKAGITEVHTYRKGTVEVRGSKLVGRILAAVDAEEAERIKARVKERHDELRRAGRPRGGVEYGYRSSRNDKGESTLEVVPAQAEVIRWCAQALLDGWSLQSVAKDLNGRGVPTLRGKQWGATTVRRMISKPSVAGLRTVDTRGTWQPILDVDQWRQVRSLLDGRAVAKVRPRRRFLLTGLTVCGRCGGRMGAQQKKGGPRSLLTARYFCRPYRGQCQKVSISADPLEAHVAGVLLDELDRPDFLAAFTEDEHETERVRLVQELRGVELRRARAGPRGRRRCCHGGRMEGDAGRARR